MRKLKFRAWDKEMEKMYIELSIYRNGFRVPNNSTTGHNDKTGHFIRWDDEKPRAVLMQFTGLCDQKGKEGYHKDICRIPKDHAWALFCLKKSVNAVIEWDRGCFYLMCSLNGVERYCSIENLKYSEIIGNEPQNPELLGKKP